MSRGNSLSPERCFAGYVEPNGRAVAGNPFWGESGPVENAKESDWRGAPARKQILCTSVVSPRGTLNSPGQVTVLPECHGCRCTIATLSGGWCRIVSRRIDSESRREGRFLERMEWWAWGSWIAWVVNGLFPSISEEPTYPHQSIADNGSQMTATGFHGTRTIMI
jgi:hypothetical protein